jgi:hypothetical protein
VTGDGDATVSTAPPARRVLRAAVQVVGFAVGLALLWWVIEGVFAPENRAQLDRLRDAPALSVAALLGLGLATLVINGAIFHIALWPVKRLRTADIQSVNAIAAVLALLPFKLSVLFRVLVHNRRDRVPLLTIAAWFAAVAACMAVSALPPLAASLWRKTLDGAWWGVALGGIAFGAIAMIALAKLLSDGPGWAWLERVIKSLPLPVAIRGSRDDNASPGMRPRVQEGLRMLAHGRAVSACIALRMLDAAVHTARFLVAASILGVDLPASKAVIAGAAFFLIGAAAPTGQLGAREAGTAGILGTLLHGVDLSQFKLVVLLVSATEATVLLVAAAAGAAWLRPWRGGGR